MILRYGSYEHPDHECLPSFFGQERIFNQRGNAYIKRKRMVIDGEIVANGTSAIDARVSQILNAYSVDGGNVLLTQSDGLPTNFRLGHESISGVRVVEGPSFFTQDGKAHLATGLPFSITLEADYLESNDVLQFYEERITRIGTGGPRSVTIELDNGPPVKQVVSSHTPIIVVQSGTAVGISVRPTPNAPLFPDFMDGPEDNQVTNGSPQMNGGFPMNYMVSWNYRFTLTSPTSIPLPLLR